MFSPPCWSQKRSCCPKRFGMTKNKKKPSAPFRRFACAAWALTSLAASCPVHAAENYFHSYAPSAPPPLGFPPAFLGHETRIPAARPPVAAGPAHANYGEVAAP